MGQEQDQELVARARRGDLGAFNCLVEGYQGQAYNLAARMLGDHALAHDATQEAFLSVYRGLGSYRGGNFRAWLLRIVANACRDLLRSSRRRPSLSLDDQDLALTSVLPSSQESPEEYALRRELGGEIQRGLALLSEDQRLILTLVDLQGLSYEAAAAIVGTKVGTVKSRLSRGRTALKGHLLQRQELLPPEFRLTR